jgi:hypothetical protein
MSRSWFVKNLSGNESKHFMITDHYQDQGCAGSGSNPVHDPDPEQLFQNIFWLTYSRKILDQKSSKKGLPSKLKENPPAIQKALKKFKTPPNVFFFGGYIGIGLQAVSLDCIS